MTTGRMIELAAAVLLLGAGIYFYRARKQADAGYGSQGAVLMIVVAAILAVHALGLLDYRPSQSELEALQERSR
jgi:hypothetical protein